MKVLDLFIGRGHLPVLVFWEELRTGFECPESSGQQRCQQYAATSKKISLTTSVPFFTVTGPRARANDLSIC